RHLLPLASEHALPCVPRPSSMGARRLPRINAALVAAGDLQDDPAQAELARRFDDLRLRLAHAAARPPEGRLRRLLGGRPEFVRGLYVHGAVGRGKTMLMDAF